jgi:hypothetical protein
MPLQFKTHKSWALYREKQDPKETKNKKQAVSMKLIIPKIMLYDNPVAK